MAKAWILYYKQGERWQHNNRNGADAIAGQFGRIQTFFEKAGLEFGTQEDLPPQGDLGHTFLDCHLTMDDGTQLNLQVVVDRTIADMDDPAPAGPRGDDPPVPEG